MNNEVYVVLIVFPDGTSNVSQTAYETLEDAQAFCKSRSTNIEVINEWSYSDGKIFYYIRVVNVKPHIVLKSLYEATAIAIHKDDTSEYLKTHILSDSIVRAERDVKHMWKTFRPHDLIRDIHIKKVGDLDDVIISSR